MSVLEDNIKLMLASDILKTGSEESFLLNKDYTVKYKDFIGLLFLEFCVSLKNTRTEVKFIDGDIYISIDKLESVEIKKQAIVNLLHLLEMYHQEADRELFTHLGKCLRKVALTPKEIDPELKIKEMVKGF